MWTSTVVLCGLVLLGTIPSSISLPSHHKKHHKPSNVSLFPASRETQAAGKRAFPMIVAAFGAFGKLADFMGQCNNVVGWFDNINGFMGGDEGSDATGTNDLITKIQNQIAELSDNVKDGFADLLAGQQYVEILAAITADVRMLGIIQDLQERYMEKASEFASSDSPNATQMRLLKDKWYTDVSGRYIDLQNALISFENHVCGPILTSSNVFEAYAAKNGEQTTGGNLVSLMEFITKIRRLQAVGYGVWKSHIQTMYSHDKCTLPRPPDSAEDDCVIMQDIQEDDIEGRMGEVAGCENPPIARAMSTMADHKGMPAYGRIRTVYNTSITTGWDSDGYAKRDYFPLCLTNLAGDGETNPYGRPCTDNQNQQWKLNADNTLTPKNDPSKCLFLVAPDESMGDGTINEMPMYGFRVFSCDNNLYRNKKFTFDYLTHTVNGMPKMHTNFKIRAKNQHFTLEIWQGKNFCIGFKKGTPQRPLGTSLEEEFIPYVFTCTCAEHDQAAAHQCIGDSDHVPYLPDRFYYFTFEPKSE